MHLSFGKTSSRGGGGDGVDVVVLDESADGPAEAELYKKKMRGRDYDMPSFDLELICSGDNGHVRSLYPSRDEAKTGGHGAPWVLLVCAKDQPSITLSLHVMKSTKKHVVTVCGVSEIYPKGKSEDTYQVLRNIF